MNLFNCAGMEHMKTFNKLSSYDVDFKCEKIYVAMEQFVTEHDRGTPKGSLPITLAEFRQVYMKGIRQYFCDMVRAQKNCFEHYIEAMHKTSYMPVELTDEEIRQHEQAYPHVVSDCQGADQQKTCKRT